MEKKPRVHESWHPVIRESHRVEIPEERKKYLGDRVHREISEAQKKGVAAEEAMRQAQAVAAKQAAAVKDDVHPKEKELKEMEADDQVRFLAHVALEEGVEPAVALARKVGSAFVIDELHDLIVDELFKVIQKQHSGG